MINEINLDFIKTRGNLFTPKDHGFNRSKDGIYVNEQGIMVENTAIPSEMARAIPQQGGNTTDLRPIGYNRVVGTPSRRGRNIKPDTSRKNRYT